MTLGKCNVHKSNFSSLLSTPYLSLYLLLHLSISLLCAYSIQLDNHELFFPSSANQSTQYLSV